MQKNSFDYMIVGAGVVGANIFSALARQGLSCVMVDKALDVSTGASKANSGLVHAGFDPEPNTLKAKLNVLGNKMYESEAKRLGLKITKTGAFVVGDDIKMIRKLEERAKANGVNDVFVLNKEELHSKLPMIRENIKYGLFAKNAYIVSPYMFTICLTEEGIVNGGKVCLGFEPKRIRKVGDYYSVSNGETELFAKTIINAAGGGYNQVAKLIGSEIYNHEFRRGEYYVLDSTEKDLVPSTIFPLPTAAGKGVLITPTIDGNILIGPNSEVTDTSTKTTATGINFVKEKAKDIVPSINLKKTIRIFAGVRSIVGSDFVIEKSKIKENVINIAGICSPGLSAAPAIALYVLDMLGISTKIKPAEKIEPYLNFNSLSRSKQNEIIAKNPAYGRIVCKCEGISEGEIIAALSRPLKVYSVDGIKRRTRTGMGRCQGGFCLSKTIELIAKKNKISVFDVVKENKGSNIIVSEVKK